MSKIFKLIRPKSETDSDYEAFEYLIRWIGKDGSDYQYMFYDAELQRRVRNEIINEESSINIEALINSESQSVTLMADDLTLSDIGIMLQLFSNKFITRLLKDGTTERFVPDSNSYKYRLRDGRYNIEFTLIGSNLAVWK